MLPWLIAGAVLGGLWLIGQASRQSAWPQGRADGTGPSPGTAQLPPQLAKLAKGAGVLALAQQAYGYAKNVYQVYQTGGSLLASGAGEAAGTVTGDVLGTGALTATAPDILLPVGTEAGAEVGTEVAAETVASAAPGVTVAAVSTALAALGAVALVGKLAEVLINLGLNEYEPGSISKELMRRRQIAIFQQGNALMEQAITAARDWPSAIALLAHAPAGTSGQVQFGVGGEYAGMHLAVGQAGTTETGQWANLIAILSRADVLRDHPEVIANFIGNLWVQLGPGGATSYDPQATLEWRAILLSKLPYHPEWNAVRQRILNLDPRVDPRNLSARDAMILALPEMPADDFLRVGWAKLDTRKSYQTYRVDLSPPIHDRFSVEQAAVQLAGTSPYDLIPSGGHPTLIEIDGRFPDTYGWLEIGSTVVVPDPDGWAGRVGHYYETNTGDKAPYAPGWFQTHHGPGWVLDPALLDPRAARTPLFDYLGGQAVESARLAVIQAASTAIPSFGY